MKENDKPDPCTLSIQSTFEPEGIQGAPRSALLDTRLAALRLNVGKTTLYSLIRSGAIGTVRIGRRRLIPSSEIDRFISTSTSHSVTDTQERP